MRIVTTPTKLRSDPVLKASAADRRPKNPTWSSQPTLSRWKTSVDEYDLERLLAALVEHYLANAGRPSI